jgi:aspartate-semialdehyde dehydrogenase
MTPPEHSIPVAVLGATGSVGQRFVQLLLNHPWFQLVALTASERSAGKRYGEAARWIQATPLPPAIADMTLLPTQTGIDVPLVFSALDAGVAGDFESAFAQDGYVVVSNAKNHRMAADVPLLVPEVNPTHLDLAQQQKYGGGAIITNPNCSTIGMVLALKPIYDAFGITQVQVVTMQAISGAGLPGIAGMEITDNVLPHIGGEEEKMELETRKIMGHLQGGAITEANLTISAHCNRVNVIDGHTECISVSLERSATPENIIEAWTSFKSEPQKLDLPSAPAQPVHYFHEAGYPQPRLHRDLEGGMAVSVGRLRSCPVLDYKFVALSHNTIRGAAGGSILAAELAVAKGLLSGARAAKGHG